MAMRFNGNIQTLLAVALLGSSLACGDPRPVASQQGLATCLRCHGQPPDTNAHLAHVSGGGLGVAVACGECHVIPTTIGQPGHIENPAPVTFGPLASKNGLSPTFDPATQTCSNVYCHGNFNLSKAPPATPPAPNWSAGSTAVACGSCHDLPPPAPTHVNLQGLPGCNGNPNFPALACHPAPGAGKPGYSYDPVTKIGTVDPALHIDGQICPPSCTPVTP
jgi:predicted CxxxxCH...CXXCH cytochrome family protein